MAYIWAVTSYANWANWEDAHQASKDPKVTVTPLCERRFASWAKIWEDRWLHRDGGGALVGWNFSPMLVASWKWRLRCVSFNEMSFWIKINDCFVVFDWYPGTGIHPTVCFLGWYDVVLVPPTRCRILTSIGMFWLQQDQFGDVYIYRVKGGNVANSHTHMIHMSHVWKIHSWDVVLCDEGTLGVPTLQVLCFCFLV